ncbi:hypothetical protein GH714_033169 [Hevea brasiliensis]|uniref:Uncharacterized protein n=1 Tax=Hevea brasiliensis TaxID=3981 RepID=A0A6A6L528_HEVBR|nr:hypothetical protein GH714_033169 [Hevea brasiliensis]
MGTIISPIGIGPGLGQARLTSSSPPSLPKAETATTGPKTQRRILHQPLFPANSAPPPETDSSSPPPPPDNQVFPTPDQPFFPEVPTGPTPDQSQPATASPANGTIPIPTATQPAKPAKKVAVAISVAIVTLGMLSGLAFFLYRHRLSTQARLRNSSEAILKDSQMNL